MALGKKAACIRSGWMRSIISTSGSACDRLVEVEADRDRPALGVAAAAVSAGATRCTLGAERGRAATRSTARRGSAGCRRRSSTRTPSRALPRAAVAVQAPADRERVEQRLGRMLVGAVAGVDDAGVDPAARRRAPAGAPEARWRMTTASAPIACRVCAVSLRLSPFETLEPLALKLMTSALRPLRRRPRTRSGCGSSPRRRG